MLPRNLILVRHGQSEGNIANSRSRAGDEQDFTSVLENRHSTELRLTDKGQAQARAAGDWLRQHGLTQFDRHYVSEYARALETAALLELPNAKWYVDAQLRELDHGLVDNMPDKVRLQAFGDYFKFRKKHLFYAPWPYGESMAEACDRLRNNIIGTLHRELADKNVIIVCHGELMRAFRVILERISANTYHRLYQEDPTWFKVGNGQIIHYTRVDPSDHTIIRPYMGWVKSVNPYDPAYAGHDWQRIERQTYSNADLLALANQHQRLIND